MTFIKTLRCDLNKTFVNLGFAGAAALTFLLCFTAPAYSDNMTGKTYSIFEALFSMDRKFIESHSEFAASSLSRMGMSGYVTLSVRRVCGADRHFAVYGCDASAVSANVVI